jgi:hypothetical protein
MRHSTPKAPVVGGSTITAPARTRMSGVWAKTEATNSITIASLTEIGMFGITVPL